MYNPLLPDPSDLKDNDIENKIQDLTRKYYIAARSGQGGVCQQIITALDMYKYELSRRQAEATKNLMKKQDKDLDDLINVNR
jgi:hypothetical protein